MTGAFFHNNGVDLFYVVGGPPTGAPILLLHGWTCDNTDWSWQKPFLQDLGFQTIAIDHRGHGRSSIPAEANYAPHDLADDAAALLTHLQIPSAVVMGHSLGTLVASALAIRHPQKAKALVLVDPVYNSSGAELQPFVDLLLASPTPAAVAADFFGAHFYTPASPPWLKAWHRDRTLGNPAHVVAAVLRQMAGEDESSCRRENAVVYNKRRVAPRLVVVGFPEKVEVEREIGLDAETDRVEVMEAGHWFHQQDADAFHALVKEWFEARGLVPGGH